MPKRLISLARTAAIVSLVSGAATGAAVAQSESQSPQPPAKDQPTAGVDGFLCCSMLSDGSWISDINYFDSRKQLLPAGTPVKVTGPGRWRLLVEIGGKKQAIGNDYSRTVNMEEFQRRYVLAEDPSARLAAYPPAVRDAIRARKVMRGMTREQVLMALGYPVASYTADLAAPLWRYWFDRSSEYQVFWGEDGKVDRIFGSPEVRAKVALE